MPAIKSGQADHRLLESLVATVAALEDGTTINLAKLAPTFKAVTAEDLTATDDFTASDVVAGKRINFTAVATIAAAGANQGAATALDSTHGLQIVTGADGAKGVGLPLLSSGSEGLCRELYNASASSLLIYPNTSQTIGGSAANAAITVPGYSHVLLRFVTTTNWSATVTDGVFAVTATTGGATTGLIPGEASLAVVTSDSADKQISLPIASVGKELFISVGTTACELISAVAAHKVNNVTVGATNELALAASTLYRCYYRAANEWVVTGITNVGTPKLTTTAGLTAITHTAPGTPDYALQNLVQNTGFGFATADEGNTLLSVVLNLQQQMAQIVAATATIPDTL